MKKKVLVYLALILACFACMSISAYADDEVTDAVVWNETQDTSYVGEYGTVYYRLNDNESYFSSDILDDSLSLSEILDSFANRLDGVFDPIDLYIYINQDCYGIIPGNLPQLDSFEVYTNGHELYLNSNTGCVKCNNFKLIGIEGFDDMFTYFTGQFFEANSCDFENISIYAYNYEPFLMCVQDGGEYRFTNVEFHGSYTGRAISVEAPNVHIEMDGCMFGTPDLPSEIKSGDYGAIVVNAENVEIDGNFSEITEQRTQFNGCEAGYYGAAITVFANDTKIKGFLFDSCSAEYGGAVYVNDGITGFNISDCEFNGNKSWNDGAAIYVNGSGFYANNCTFNNNQSQDCGGAICSNADNATIENCIFIENESSDCGGAVYASGYFAVVRNCSFYGNVTNNCGGGLYIDQDSDTVEYCAFANNNAYDGDSSYGKSLYLDDKDGIVINSCRFGESYQDEIYFKWDHTPATENCQENLGADSFDTWGYFWQTGTPVGSLFSSGSIWLIIAIFVVVLGVIAVLLIKKNKKYPL